MNACLLYFFCRTSLQSMPIFFCILKGFLRGVPLYMFLLINKSKQGWNATCVYLHTFSVNLTCFTVLSIHQSSITSITCIWFVKWYGCGQKILSFYQYLRLVTITVPLCSVHQASSYEANSPFMSGFFTIIGLLEHVIYARNSLHCRQSSPAQE